MPSSAEIWVCNKLVEIAERCGVSPVNAEIDFTYMTPSDGSDFYSMSAIDVTSGVSDEDARKIRKVWSLLGLDERGIGRFDTIVDAAEAVNRALALAPRSRSR